MEKQCELSNIGGLRSVWYTELKLKFYGIELDELSSPIPIHFFALPILNPHIFVLQNNNGIEISNFNFMA